MIIHQDISDIDVAAHSMDSMCCANGKAVAVAAAGDNGQFRVCQLNALGKRQSAAMSCMHTVGV
jgi:pectin methylesterase-like acyl-CoA thioesterase